MSIKESFKTVQLLMSNVVILTEIKRIEVILLGSVCLS